MFCCSTTAQSMDGQRYLNPGHQSRASGFVQVPFPDSSDT